MNRGVPCAVLLLALVLPTHLDAQSFTVCGNGVREFDEECDDANTDNLDGCSASCLFEQSHRINLLTLQQSATNLCTSNAFGGAFLANGYTAYQTTLSDAISSGAASTLLAFLDLDDRSGTSDQAMTVGVMTGGPLAAGNTYDGTNDLDWWHAPDAGQVTSGSAPSALLSASISAKALVAGPGQAMIDTGTGSFSMSSLLLRATTGAADTPRSATGAAPPGHLSSERLNPAITSFATSGASASGTLCGNISAASLDATPIPSAFVGCGTGKCTRCYTSAESLLDLLVGGCVVATGLAVLPTVVATQPDAFNEYVLPAGAGAPYALSFSGKSVTGCRDKNGSTVTLSTCLNAAAYSSLFKYSTNRVIIRPSCPPAPVVSASPACTGETLQLTAVGPTGSYQWSGPNGFTSTEQNPAIANVTEAASGTYSATVTLAGCTSQAGTTNVTVTNLPSAPVITAPRELVQSSAGAASVPARGGSTYTWTITNGTIITGQGTNQIAFSTGTPGTTVLNVVESSGSCESAQATASVSVFGAPSNVTATVTYRPPDGSTNSPIPTTTISWTPNGQGGIYEIAWNYGGTFEVITPAGTNPTVLDRVAGTAVYRIRAYDAYGNSLPPVYDYTMRGQFTDDPLVDLSPVKALHVTELRTIVNNIRFAASQPQLSFSDPVLDATIRIRAVHLTELRAGLDQLRAALGLPPLSYGETISAGTTVKASHIRELREGVK